MSTLDLDILKIDCPNCARECEEAVGNLKSVASADLDYNTAKLKVKYNEQEVKEKDLLQEIVRAVRSTNHDVALSEAQSRELGLSQSWVEEHKKELFLAGSGISVALAFIVGFLSNSFPSLSLVQNALFILAAFIGLAAIFPLFVNAIKSRTINMSILMTVAVFGAIYLGAYGEGAVVIFLYLVGEYLEGVSMQKTRSSIKELLDLAPEIAHLIQPDGSVVDSDLDDINKGSRLLIKPGERVPLDAEIVLGSSALNEAAVTGESLAVDKTVGDKVFAGTLNTHGVLEVITTATQKDSMLAKIVEMVEDAQANKAEAAKFIDRFAAVYTPIVMVIAILVAIVPPLITTYSPYDVGSWNRWLYSAISMLVIACPCALVISTPVTIVSAITAGARQGILIKGGNNLEAGAKIDHVLFDKTGTLTIGKPQVTELVRTKSSLSEEQVIALAYGLEKNSNHPLAKAIVSFAKTHKAPELELSNVKEIAAQGVQGEYEGVSYKIGKLDFVADKEAFGENYREAEAALDAASHKGASPIVLGDGKCALAVFVLSDTLRKEARSAIRALLDEGVKHVEMLTGDNKKSAHSIACELGLTDVQAELLPQDKIARVKELQKRESHVAMVGDGINDAPALAQAEVGVAMGAAASDTALEVSDVAVLRNDLSLLAKFIKLSKRAMSTIKINIAFALGIKITFLILAFFGLTSMWLAIFADTGVTLIVILFGMRLMLGSRSKEA